MPEPEIPTDPAPSALSAVPLPGTGEPLPLGVDLAPTGHPAVDAGLARLEALDGVPTDAHVAVYEDVHQRLADTLAALDRD
ncbi:hypothetical protein ABTX81_26920 [Kitasatospora sp. NPDC097605]|uniref:hypothetical protein n=1 Tax=Kitasatospora sp. NPDC097605 TaxID=3157226 RepID=UPI00332F83CF